MKDVLVLATGGRDDENRFAYAEKLAEQFSANIDVVLANELPSPSVMSALHHAPEKAATSARDAALQNGTELLSRIRKRFSSRKTSVTVVSVDELSTALGGTVVALARTRDTFICSLPGQDHELELSAKILDRVLIEGGRCVVGLPREFEGGHPIREITIAWNSSREAVRATAEAMPLLKQADSVVILLVDPPRRAEREELLPGEDLLLHPTRHGVKAKIARVASDQLRTLEGILIEARRQGAQLLVIGARAEAGLLQWLQSSVSREEVSKTHLPLFMAH